MRVSFKEGNHMPMYDYKCGECGKEFLLALTLKEHERGVAACPFCGSKKLEQLITAFTARTSKKS
jgi:putative FmdB family regulatory protein